MKSLSKAYNPKLVEARIYKLWEKRGFFNPDKLPSKAPSEQRGKPKTYKPEKPRGPRASTGLQAKSYSIVIPPPNITGELHMGHALNAAIQDVLIRKKRMEGFQTLWLPGIDHAGIAAQNVVERELKKEGKTRFDLGREKFRERAWQWKKKYGHIILDQFKKLGCSLDWSRTRFTMDRDYSRAVNQAFLHYYKRGWIYQGERTVNWCIRCSTSLSDLEVVYQEEPASMYYIKYGPLSIATVRPETKLGDTAIAVNPKDPRYKKYIGKIIEIKTVLGKAKMKVIGDEAVDMSFGTGAMKVTPAHDMHDFELGEKHGLERKQVIGPDGRMTELAGKYAGLRVKEARKKIGEDMKKIGILEKVEPYTHSVARCYRCNTVLEPILSKQWFLKMKDLAQLAERPVKQGKISFYPKSFERGYLSWLANIRDWCISRQLWWGHQLPIWQCRIGRNPKPQITNYKPIRQAQGPEFIEGQIPNPKFKIQNQYFIALEKPRKCPICKKCKPRQVGDVLDTWFSSALWPFATLGWPIACAQNKKSKIKNKKDCTPKKNSDLDKFYPTTVLSTDRGIINLWVARMIFSGMEFMKKIPFQKVYIHPTVLTREGKRMSKSLGTGVDPIHLIEKYGADATRFGILYQVMGGQDIKFGEDNIVMGKKFCNKIWNASRFVMLQTANEKATLRGVSHFARYSIVPGFVRSSKMKNEKLQSKIQNLTLPDKKILKQLHETVKSVNENIESFRFGPAAHRIYDFFWHDFCDIYLEVSKKQLQATRYQLGTTNVLMYVLFDSLKMLHPFVPFLTEEIYQTLPIKGKKKSLMVETWPQ